MWAYLILTIGSLVFWALYQMAPSGLQLFAVNNVDRNVRGWLIAPSGSRTSTRSSSSWGGLSCPRRSSDCARAGGRSTFPEQFAAALFLMALGFLVLPAGIAFANPAGMVADVCAAAANNGYLNILKWARENECPWDETTCSWAASSGQFQTLKWAKDNGCPWNEDTITEALKQGHWNVAIWAIDNGCPKPKILEYQ